MSFNNFALLNLLAARESKDVLHDSYARTINYLTKTDLLALTYYLLIIGLNI